MDKTVVCIDTFSGAVADLPKAKRTDRDILAALQRDPMVSCFDFMEKAWLRRIFDLVGRGLLAHEKLGFPWDKFTLTDAGRALLAESEAS